MKVTDEMVERALCVWDELGEVEAPNNWVPKALEAALADVPEPGEFVDDDAFYASVADDLAELEAADPKIKALGDKVREAERAFVDSLSPGVRRLVVALRERGFETTDSGDGVANVEAAMEGALTVAHVHVQVRTPTLIISESHRLQDALADLLKAGSPHVVQAMYSPQDGVATVSVFGADDSLLAENEEGTS